MIATEPIYQALFDLSANVAWADGAFAYTARRVKLWDDLTAQPALCQAEFGETVEWKTNLPPKRTLEATWFLYHQAGKDSDAVPATTTNLMLDAVMALFVDDGPEGVQQLGLNVGSGIDRRVYRCWVEGKIQKFQGDLDGQTLVLVPIKIMIP